MLYALWRALRQRDRATAASRAGRAAGAARRLRDGLPGRRAQPARVPALVRLLPAADGVRVRPVPGATGRERGRGAAAARRAPARRPALRARGDAADPRRRRSRVYDYMRVVVIFAPPADAGAARAAHRRRPAAACSSATTPTTPPRPSPSIPAQVMQAFERAPHYLLDARLMMAWAQGARRSRRDRQGALRRAAPEGIPQRAGRASSSRRAATPRAPAAAADAAVAPPFQCQAADARVRFEDFR